MDLAPLFESGVPAPDPAASRAPRPLAVRLAEPRDFPAIRRLQRERGAAMAPWTARHLAAQRERFPEGQLVAELDGRIVGAAASLVVQWDDYAIDHTWNAITAEGSFSTHDREGRTLYGAELVVDRRRPAAAIVRALHAAQRRICDALMLRRMIAAIRMPGFHKVRRTMTAEVYAMRVVWGDIVDPELSFHLAEGFRYCGVIHNYRPEDGPSCGNAAVVAWPNPRYRIFTPKRTLRARTSALAPSPPALAL